MPVQRPYSEKLPAPAQMATAGTYGASAEDMELVERLIANCETAWRELVTRFAGQVRARVLRVTKSCSSVDQVSLVDDILAEVFRALLANDRAALRAYQGRSSLCTYLCAIATRVTLRYSLRHGPGVQASEELSSLEDPKSTSPEKNLQSFEQNQWLLQRIDRLPWKQQQLIRLFHLEGKSYKEISEQLSMPIGSIGPSIGRAEKQLRQLLGENFID